MLLKPLLSCFLLGVKLPLVYTTRQQLRFLLNVQKLFILPWGIIVFLQS